MNDEVYRKCLEESKVKLVSGVITSELFVAYVQENTLTKFEKEELMAIPTQHSRMIRALRILADKPRPKETFHAVLAALRGCDYHYLADDMEELLAKLQAGSGETCSALGDTPSLARDPSVSSTHTIAPSEPITQSPSAVALAQQRLHQVLEGPEELVCVGLGRPGESETLDAFAVLGRAERRRAGFLPRRVHPMASAAFIPGFVNSGQSPPRCLALYEGRLLPLLMACPPSGADYSGMREVGRLPRTLAPSGRALGLLSGGQQSPVVVHCAGSNSSASAIGQQIASSFGWASALEACWNVPQLIGDSTSCRVHLGLGCGGGEREVVRWEAGPTLATSRCDFALLEADGWLYAIGGRSNRSLRPTASVERWKVDEPGGGWQHCCALPKGLSGHAAVLLRRRIVVLGGSSWDSKSSALKSSDKCYALDLDSSGEWRKMTGRLKRAREQHGAAVVNGHLVVFGGSPRGVTSALTAGSLEVYDETHDQWLLVDHEALPCPMFKIFASRVSDKPN